MTFTEIVTIVLGCAGMLFMLISLAGIVRFPDFFTRLHAQGIGDTLGAFLIIVAMMVAAGANLLAIKIFLIFIIIVLTNPLGTNLMIIAAIHMKDYLDYNNREAEEEHQEEAGSDGNRTN